MIRSNAFKVTLMILILIFFLYNIFSNDFLNKISGNSIKDLEKEGSPLEISELITENFKENSACYSIISGKLSNEGIDDKTSILIDCNPALYPIIDRDIKDIDAKKEIDVLHGKEVMNFEIKVKSICEKKLRFKCFVS
jgi:hypothetical protein